jgi:hypothetical protein
VVRARSGAIALANEICEWAIATGKTPKGIAISEAHMIARNRGTLPEPLEELVTCWRHYSVALWCDTQRPALLNTTIINLSRDLRLYSIIGKHDLQVVEAIGGDALVLAVQQCTQRFAAGQPGWHVRLGPSRLPPYPVQRD